MNEAKSSLLIKRPVRLKVVVTPRWKEEVQQQLQTQINQLDSQMQQLESQGQQAISQIQAQGGKSIDPQAMQQQVKNIQAQINQKKTKLLEQKNQALQQLQQVQLLEPEQEVYQGQIDSFVRIESGDNLAMKMNVEVLLRDGIVEEIRGEV